MYKSHRYAKTISESSDKNEDQEAIDKMEVSARNAAADAAKAALDTKDSIKRQIRKKARVADRTEGHGCPYCAGQRVWKGFNDLATTHPDLISEWSDKNKGISPETITYKNRSLS